MGGYFSSVDLEIGVCVCLRARGVRLRKDQNIECYYKVLVEKLPGPQFSVRSFEVSAYGRCPLAEV